MSTGDKRRYKDYRGYKRKTMGKGGFMHYVRVHRKGYVYGRWTNYYIDCMIHKVFPHLGSFGKKYLSDHYHGKILTQEAAEAIISIDEDIPLMDLEHVIPYPMARDIVLKGSPEVLAYECACRHSRENPCSPTQVCMIVGQPFVDLFHEHNPEHSRKLTKEEALQLLRDERDRGHMHTAFFRSSMMDRFYAICNCCKCCCGGIEAMQKYSIPMIASSGYVARVDQEKCQGCGTCVKACPFDAIVVVDGKSIVDFDKCLGCGVCEAKCPQKAACLEEDARKGEPLDIVELSEEAKLSEG